jgi:hypothetical protein
MARWNARKPDRRFATDAKSGRRPLRLERLEARDVPSFLPPLSYPAGSTLYGSAIADMNGDRRLDFVSAAYDAGAVAVYRGDGSGRLTAAAFFADGPDPYQLRVGDLNADGRPDVVTTNGGAKVGVLLNNGDGTLTLHSQPPAPSGTTYIAVGDFNRDGRPDLVTSAGSANAVHVWFGNGDGTFQAPLAYAVSGPGGIQTADLNGDGWPDVTTISPGGNVVNVLLNRGDGTLLPPRAYPAGNYPFVHLLADANGDGRPDVIVADFHGNAVSVLFTNAAGTLQPLVAYPTGPDPFDPRLADFNRDGRLDLAVANYGNSTLGIFLGTGNGAFGPRTDYPVGKSDIRTLEVGDLNNDRFPDAVVPTGYGAGCFVNVLRNDGNWTPPVPPPGPGRSAEPPAALSADAGRSANPSPVRAPVEDDSAAVAPHKTAASMAASPPTSVHDAQDLPETFRVLQEPFALSSGSK